MKMPQVTPHSGPKKILKHNSTRKSVLSPSTAQVVPHSGHLGMGRPYSTGGDRMEQKFTSKAMVVPHSPIGVPKAPRKWNKQKMASGVAMQMSDD